MQPYTLTVLDTQSIQPYIFASNRLQEMIGASELVEKATHRWAYEALQEVAPGGHNIQNITTGEVNPRRIENPADNLQVELIYAGGGNTVLIFKSGALARSFTTALTSRVLREAPGLNLVVAHQEVNWGAGRLGQQISETIEQRLAKRKFSRPLSTPILGLGVTAVCSSTGRAAAGTTEGLRSKDSQEEVRLVSREAMCKLAERQNANKRLNDLFADLLENYFEFPWDIDELGRWAGRESYVAVVHADGNGLGKRVSRMKELYPDNREYIDNIRLFSDSVAAASEVALREVVAALTRLAPNKRYGKFDILPFRPLIYGGDDVTFLCQGNLGIPLAALYLREFERQKLKGVPDNLADIHACAGICIVKMHYPFSRAYSVSEELCKGAKTLVRMTNEDRSALDWHFSTSGLAGELDEIRLREYHVESGCLHLRPLFLHPAPSLTDGISWYGQMESLVKFFSSEEWQRGRNKIKALRKALRLGPHQVEQFLQMIDQSQLPEVVPGDTIFRSNGWAGGRCGYFDAIELLDHYQAVG